MFSWITTCDSMIHSLINGFIHCNWLMQWCVLKLGCCLIYKWLINLVDAKLFSIIYSPILYVCKQCPSLCHYWIHWDSYYYYHWYGYLGNNYILLSVLVMLTVVGVRWCWLCDSDVSLCTCIVAVSISCVPCVTQWTVMLCVRHFLCCDMV